MKKLLIVSSLAVLLMACGDEVETSEPAVTKPPTEVKKDNTTNKKPSTELTFNEKAIANTETYPASAGKMLYGADYKGLPYYFEGEVIGFIIVEGNNSALVKNDKGYVMPINPFENELEVGQTVKVYGNLSGDGYANKDLGVDNVVGMTGYINATTIE